MPLAESLKEYNDIEYTNERDLIASVFADAECFGDVDGVIDSRDFSRESTRYIWDAFSALNAAGTPIDYFTVRNQMADNKTFDAIGGNVGLQDMTSHAVTGANAEYYAKTITEAARKRRLARAIESIKMKLHRTSADDTIGELEQTITDAGSAGTDVVPVSVNELYQEQLGKIITAIESGNAGLTGLTSGFVDLDSMLSGYHGGELIIMAGRPSMGKSTLMLNQARKMASEGNPILIFSLEMSRENIISNISVAQLRIQAQNLRKMTLTKDELEKVTTRSEEVTDLPIYVEDTAGLQLKKMQAVSKRWHRKHGIKAIFVDYLQLLTVGHNSNRSREQEVASISRGLKKLAKDLNIPIIALSQLSRANTQRKDQRPMLSDLRESGAIEQDADVVLFVHRDEYYDGTRPGIADIIIAKQRNGPVGNVETSFIGSQLRFENFSSQSSHSGGYSANG